MVIKTVRAISIIVLATIFTYSTCRKEGIGGCTDTVYYFQIYSQAYPDTDSLKVGDTLWIEVNSPTSFRDSLSNQIIDYSNAENLGSAISFQKIVENKSFISSTQSFSFFLLKGKEVTNSNADLIKEYTFDQQGSYYVFKLGIIVREKGVFAIAFSNAANVYRSTDKCTKASFEINFENTNQHYYLNPNSNGYTGKGGDYYFKVY